MTALAETLRSDFLKRGERVDLSLIETALRDCGDLDEALVAEHFRSAPQVRQYLRDYPPEVIRDHLLLLDRLRQEGWAAVAVRERADPDVLDVAVAAIDAEGALTLIARALTRLALYVCDLSLIYESPTDNGQRKEFVLALQVLAASNFDKASNLEAQLEGWLKAAYWPLIRGDLDQALRVIDASDGAESRHTVGRTPR